MALLQIVTKLITPLERGKYLCRAEVIPAMIRTCKRFHISYQDTADSIRKELKLPDIEIEENMKLYW